MANIVRVHFWLHRSKANKAGLVPLIIRLRYRNKQVDKSTGFHLLPKDWSVSRQRMKGARSHSQQINSWITSQENKVGYLFDHIIRTNREVCLQRFMDDLFAPLREEKMFLSYMAEQIELMKARIGNDFARSTVEKYEFAYDKVSKFIFRFLKKRDVAFENLNIKFLKDFDQFLRTEDNNAHNTVVKYCLILKRILNLACQDQIISQNPFSGYKTPYKETRSLYLDDFEVSKLESLNLVKANHLLVRDLFIFQCYTGLAYTDLTTLSKQDISTDRNGNWWIIKQRQKTGILCTIPVLQVSLGMIQKYADLQGKRQVIFPHYSLQKYNQYLGEIGKMAGIFKKLSSHVGRRTFGNMALARGISLNVIAKILGHSNTLITQRIYAVTTQDIISREMVSWNSSQV